MNTINNFLKLITDARSLSENLMMIGYDTEANSDSEDLEYRENYSILPVTKHVCDTYLRLGYTSVRIIKRIDKPKWKNKNIDAFLLLFQDYRNIDGTSQGCEKPKFSFEDFLSLSIDILEKGSQESNEIPLTCLKPDVFCGFAGDRQGIRFYVMHYMSTASSRRHFNQFKGANSIRL
jgi:hypothetical protein